MEMTLLTVVQRAGGQTAVSCGFFPYLQFDGRAGWCLRDSRPNALKSNKSKAPLPGIHGNALLVGTTSSQAHAPARLRPRVRLKAGSSMNEVLRSDGLRQ